MESLYLLVYLVFFIVLYLLICDCFLKKKEEFYNTQGLKLLNKRNFDVKTGGYFEQQQSEAEKNKEHGEFVPLYAMSHKEKKHLFSIVNPIINNLNRKIKLKFKLVDVDSFYQQVEENGNVRLKLDVFIFETLNHYNRRLLLDVTLDYTIKKIIVNQMTLTNAKKLKVPDVNQSRDVHFHEKILTEDNKLADTQTRDAIYGRGDSKLAFHQVDFDVNKVDLASSNFTSWVFPQEYLTHLNDTLPVWPCREEDFRWDTNAVNITQIGSNSCRGINSSYQHRNYIPKFDPGMRQVDKDGDYAWTHHYFTRNFSTGITKSSEKS